MTILQNMTSFKGDRGHTNHVTSKVVICYICGKVVKDYRLSSHLLFGSLQCRDCNLKFRYCRDFNSFRKSKDEKESDLCAHQALRWTRDPAEYLKRKLRIDIAKSKPDKYRPSKREVKKKLLSYVSKLKPIEHRLPWKYAIEKLKKITSKNNISNDYECENKKHAPNNHHHEKEREKSTKRDNLEQGERKYEAREDDNYALSQNLPEKIVDENSQEYLNYSDVDSAEGNSFNVDDICASDEIVSYDQVPRYCEEIIIPQSEWELDVISCNDTEDCNKSVELYLTSGEEKDIPFIVEEVVITEHEELDHITLSVNEHECSIESESELSLFSSKASFIEYTENSVESVVEVCTERDVTDDLYDEIPNLRNKVPEDTQNEVLENSDSFQEKDYENGKEIQRRTCTEQQFSGKGQSNGDKELYMETGQNVSLGEKILSENCMHVQKQHNISKEIKATSSSRGLEKSLTKDLSSTDITNDVYRRRKPNMVKRIQMPANTLYTRTRQQYKREVNDSKSTKYNLRSRKSRTKNSFLQNLDCSEKRKLWERLMPMVKKLKKLKMQTNDASLPNFFLPLQSNEYDDDFMVDILLSWFLSTKHLKNKVSSSSSSSVSSSDDDDDYDNDYNGNAKFTRNCSETEILLKSVRKTIKEFSSSKVSSSMSGALTSSKSGVSECNSNVKISVRAPLVERRGRKPRANHLPLNKRHQVREKKTFYVNPPPDGFYYVVSYPSQPLIKECPMCYFRVFPSMFSLNLVTNLATTKCVGCMLTIYVVQEPDESNSIPKIIFRHEEPLPELKQNAPKPGRYKGRVGDKVSKKVSVRSFFKQ